MGRQDTGGPVPGETVVWQGRTARGVTATAFDGPLIAFGFLGIAIGLGLLLHGRWVTGLPVFAVGAYLFVGRFFAEAHRRQRATYVLTLDHAYVINTWPRPRTTTVDLRRVGLTTIAHHRDGTGTLTFGRLPPALIWLGPLRQEHPAFRYIEHADRLMPIVRGEATSIEA